MHSTDDDSLPFKQGVEIAKNLDGKLITYHDRGHFFKPENASHILPILLHLMQ